MRVPLPGGVSPPSGGSQWRESSQWLIEDPADTHLRTKLSPSTLIPLRPDREEPCFREDAVANGQQLGDGGKALDGAII